MYYKRKRFGFRRGRAFRPYRVRRYTTRRRYGYRRRRF